MSQFRDAYDEFRGPGVEVAAISVDSPYSHRAWAAELGIPDPMLSDFGRTLMANYGIPTHSVPFRPAVGGRSAFLIDADGIMRYAWNAPEGGGMPQVEDILEAARQLPADRDDIKTVVFVQESDRAQLAELARLIDEGQLRPQVPAVATHQ